MKYRLPSFVTASIAFDANLVALLLISLNAPLLDRVFIPLVSSACLSKQLNK